MIIKDTRFNTPFIMLTAKEVNTNVLISIIDRMWEMNEYSGVTLQTPAADEGFGYRYYNIARELDQHYKNLVDIDVYQKDCTYSRYETDKIYRFRAKFKGLKKILVENDGSEIQCL